MESSIKYLLNFFKDGDVYGVVPPSPANGVTQGIVEFLPIGYALPWAWISTILATSFIIGLVVYLFYKDLDSWGGWQGIRKNYGLWVLLSVSSLLGYLVIYWLVFAPLASFSILRKLEVDPTKKQIYIADQNFFQYTIPFSKISHLAYIRNNSKGRSGLWIVRDHRTDHAILRWSEDPTLEDKFIEWAENIAKSMDAVFVSYHERSNLFRSDKFRQYLSAQGLIEKKISIENKNRNEEENRIQWVIQSKQKEMESFDWIFWFSGVIAILMFAPFYLAFLSILCLLPELIRHFLMGYETKEELHKIILKSKIFYIGIALMLAFFVGMYNSTKYVNQADTIQIDLSKNRLFYSILNQNQQVIDRNRLTGKDFWLDLLLGNPFAILDRLAEFSRSNNIELEMNFSEVNRIRSPDQKIIFSKRENGKNEDNFETFTFDLSGLDPLVYQYILYKIQEISEIER
ncbi:hypothetical protein [Leptospira sp. GIMC2001]|uniref:hypothetical protein n=1 Tax=Leptospira sp. GIMC2001 TaxID=1513297 RepID=UPI00234B7791|nr:hypothetical protein [Leptospira sp. GIMC2001]WCL48852.1 hypothetical protein O4O04_16330 [Leptospira sp. GIMC2001]